MAAATAAAPRWWSFNSRALASPGNQRQHRLQPMRFLKRSGREHPQLSLVLLDWSVRESFHLLHYLGRQTAGRDAFEVIIIEFYGRVSEAIRRFEAEVDTWVVLDMPERCYYHKHLMYNVGIALAQGDIVMIGDSDAMVRPTFIDTIVRAFAADPHIVFHIDQFRNTRRDLYPFNYPSFEEVLGEGCINNAGGKTTGVLNTDDPIHSRNYGACMCARRADLIAIGGADEHIDYLGHICGPYDMTFRLINLGRREVWDHNEFMFHTWHPGQAGADNYMGPHDGRHMSTTALEALSSRRVLPLHQNRAIHQLRLGQPSDHHSLLANLIDPGAILAWHTEPPVGSRGDRRRPLESARMVYLGYRIERNAGRYLALPPMPSSGTAAAETELAVLEAGIRRRTPLGVKAFARIAQSLASLRLIAQLAGQAGARVARAAGANGRAIAAAERNSLAYRIQRYQIERSWIARRVGHLVAGVWRIGQDRAGNGRDAPLTVVVRSKADAVMLAVFARLCRMRGFRTVVLAEGTDVAAFLDAVERPDPHRHLVLSSDVYHRYFATLSRHPNLDSAVIL
jgi:hypothetical protein